MRVRFLKNYFLEILLFFIVTTVSTMILLSLFLYNTFEKSTTAMVNNLNQDFLAETHRINEYLQKMIRISGMELFFEPNIQKIMYQEEITNFDVVMAIRRLDSISSMSLHTHSIYVYNARKDYVYATSNLDSNRRDVFYDQAVLDLLAIRTESKRLAPIPRLLHDSSGEKAVYSFVFFEAPVGQASGQSALVFNITIDWLREVFRDNQQSKSTIMFVDYSGRIAYHTDQTRFLQDMSGSELFGKIKQSTTPHGYFIQNEPEGRKLVFYSTSSDNGLYLIRMYPYDEVMVGITAMRRSTSFLVLVFIIGAIALAFALSRRLYKPINQLVRKVGSSRPESQEERPQEQGDLGFLSASIDQMITRNDQLEKKSISYQLTLQKEALKELLLGSGEPDSNLDTMFKEYNLPFDSDLAFRMVAYKGFPLQECGLVDGCPCIAIPMLSSGTLLLFQNLPAAEERNLLQDLRDKGATLLVTSGRIDSVRQLPRLAREMDELLRFSFLHQIGSLVPVKNSFRVNSVNVYPTDMEKTMLQFLHQGKATEAIAVYEDFFMQVTTGSYDHFKFAMKRLFISLQLAVNELQKQGLFTQYKGLAIEEFESLIEQLENRAVLDRYIRGLCGEFQDEVTASRLRRAGRISDQMMEILNRDYPDPNLSLQSLADSVSMSTSYVAKVFKECIGVSVNDYLLNLRIDKAKSLLLEESLPAREIASKVGLDNENYFYTVFRKKTGQTPNAFRKERQGCS